MLPSNTKTALELIYVVVVPRSLSPVVLGTVQTSVNVIQTFTMQTLKQELHSIIMHLGWNPTCVKSWQNSINFSGRHGEIPSRRSFRTSIYARRCFANIFKMSFWASFNVWRNFFMVAVNIYNCDIWLCLCSLSCLKEISRLLYVASVIWV